MKEVKELLGLGKEYKVLMIENKIENSKTVKLIYVECTKRKEKCPKCRKYTNSIHDKLKPSKIKYLKSAEYQTYIVIRKRRFICHKCNKKIIEDIDLNNKNKNISNKLEQKILKDLLEYNLSLKYISKNNNISEKEYSSLSEDERRFYQRNLTKKCNYSLNQTANAIAKRKCLTYRKDILDNMESEELAANLFIITKHNLN